MRFLITEIKSLKSCILVKLMFTSWYMQQWFEKKCNELDALAVDKFKEVLACYL